MDRTHHITAVADLFGAGKPGYGAGERASLRPATVWSSTDANNVQEELCTAIELHGVALDAANRSQLGTLMRSPRWNPADATKDPKWDTPRVIYKLARWDQYVLSPGAWAIGHGGAESDGAQTQTNTTSMQVDISDLVPHLASVVSVDVLMMPGHANASLGDRAALGFAKITEATAQVEGANIASASPTSTALKQWVNVYTDATGVAFNRVAFAGPVSGLSLDRAMISILSGKNMSGGDREWIYAVVVGLSESYANRPW